MPKADVDPKKPLTNPKWEHFAQLLSAGTALAVAYEQAGFQPDAKNARKLAIKPEVAQRVEALQIPVLLRIGVSRQRWLDEVAALAFSDITEILEWQTDTEETFDNDDGGEVLIVKHIHSHKARFRKSSELPPNVRAMIQSVKVSAEGDIEVKLHPKIAALKLLGESMRLLGRHQKADEDPDGTPPPDERSATEITDELTALFAKALNEKQDRAADARLIEGTSTSEP